MPGLRRADAHHRNLPARTDTANPSATQKAGRMMKRPSSSHSPARRSPRRSKGRFASMPSRRRNESQTKAKRPTETPDSDPKTGQPTLQTSTSGPNSNRHQEQTSALSHSAACISRLPPCQICQRGPAPPHTNPTHWPASENLGRSRHWGGQNVEDERNQMVRYLCG